MLYQKTVTYKQILCILGWCLLVYGSYLIVVVLTSQIEIFGVTHYSGPLIFGDPNEARNYLFCGGIFPANPLLPVNSNVLGPLTPGPFLWVSLGMLCLSVSSGRAGVTYICLHIALWLISLSTWFSIIYLSGITDYGFRTFIPFILVTVVLSLVLLFAYNPIIYILRKL